MKRIEERMEEYRRNNKEQTGRSIGSEGNECHHISNGMRMGRLMK